MTHTDTNNEDYKLERRKKFFDLAERFQNATDPKEVERLRRELGTLTFGGQLDHPQETCVCKGVGCAFCYSLDDYSQAVSGVGPLTELWRTQPHKFVYDLAARAERLQLWLEAALSVAELSCPICGRTKG